MLFFNYPDDVDVVIRFLKLLKVKVNRRTVSTVLQNHPDYPSILAISDSLREWNVPNAVGKIKPNKIECLITPFLAINSSTYTLMVVNNVSNVNVSYFVGNRTLKLSKTRSEFINEWEGLFLFAEPSQESGEKKYHINKRKNRALTLFHFSIVLGIISFLIFILNNNINSNPMLNMFALIVHFLILLAGTLISGLLLRYEIDKNNPFLEKVCSGIKKGNCTKILSGKASKLFNWISWSEIGFFYFLGGLFSLIFFPENIIVPILFLLSTPYIIYSIYFQWKVAKQWCFLCLFVQCLLFSGSVNIVVNQLYTSSYGNTINSFVIISGIYLFPFLFWLVLRPYLFQFQNTKYMQNKITKLKYDRDVFNMYLQKQKKVIHHTDDLGLNIGNRYAQNTLIKICNPYCIPCSETHSKLVTLLNEYENLKIKIIFNAPAVTSLKHFKIVSYFLTIAEENDYEKLLQTLNNWYKLPRKDYNTFILKQPFKTKVINQNKKIEAMYNWVMNENIKATPVFYFNGYQLPDAYDIADLKYFLLE